MEGAMEPQPQGDRRRPSTSHLNPVAAISSMAKVLTRKKQNPYECLERILNKTTLTTQRVCHSNITEIGNGLLSRTFVDIENNTEQAVAEALQGAHERHKKELASALQDLTEQFKKEKEEALFQQKKYFESLAAKSLQQWEKAEAEKLRLLKKQYGKVFQEALKLQSEGYEECINNAIGQKNASLEKRMRSNFTLEREHAIADALGKARERFSDREAMAIKRAKEECKKESEDKITRLAAQHTEETKIQTDRYNGLFDKFTELKEQKEKAEKDFKELQRDYTNFIDNNTGGRFRSDYLIVPR